MVSGWRTTCSTLAGRDNWERCGVVLSLSDIVEAQAQARQRPAREASASGREAASRRAPERFTLAQASRPERAVRAPEEVRPERRPESSPRETGRMRPAPERAQGAAEASPAGRTPAAARDTGAMGRREAEATPAGTASAPRPRLAAERADEETSARGDAAKETGAAERAASEGTHPEATGIPPEPSPVTVPDGGAPVDPPAPSEASASPNTPPSAAEALPQAATSPAAVPPSATADRAASDPGFPSVQAAPGQTVQAASGEGAGAAASAGPAPPDGSPRDRLAGAAADQAIAFAGESVPAVAVDPAALGFEAALAALEPASAESLAGGSPAVPMAAGATGPSDIKTATPAQPAAHTPAPPAPVPLGAVPMTIGLRAFQGTNRFELRLDPAELGRIDVALEIDKERGAVSARLVVERPETLALLQRDAGSLQQALSQAGFDAAAGISLSLRSDAEGGAGERRDMQGASGGASARREGGEGPAGPIETAPLTALRALGGIDIRI